MYFKDRAVAAAEKGNGEELGSLVEPHTDSEEGSEQDDDYQKLKT